MDSASWKMYGALALLSATIAVCGGIVLGRTIAEPRPQSSPRLFMECAIVRDVAADRNNVLFGKEMDDWFSKPGSYEFPYCGKAWIMFQLDYNPRGWLPPLHCVLYAREIRSQHKIAARYTPDELMAIARPEFEAVLQRIAADEDVDVWRQDVSTILPTLRRHPDLLSAPGGRRQVIHAGPLDGGHGRRAALRPV